MLVCVDLQRTQRTVLDAKETNAAQLQQGLQQSISRLEGSRVDYVEVGRLSRP